MGSFDPAVIVLAVFLPYGMRAFRRIGAHEYRTYHSPDRRYQIVVYRMPVFFAMMPGQASDAPGYFQLRESKTGRLLQDQDVEMVQDVDQVEWSPTEVHVGILVDWKLPP